VPELGEGRGRERDLGKRRQPLGDEALEPAQRGPLEPCRVPLRQQPAQVEGVVEAELAELARGHFGAAKIAVRYSAGEAAVCGPLRRHGGSRWGDEREPTLGRAMSKPRAGNRMRLAVAAAAFATVGGGAPVATTARASVGFRGAVDVVAVSPATGRVLVGIEGGKPGSGLWWSDDRGAHWHVALGLGKASGVTALAFSPSQPNVVYAGADWLTARGLASGFLVSSDGGTSWRAAKWRQSVDVFQASAAIEELVVDPSSPDTVYADTRGVLRRTLNAGKTWARIGAALPLAITGVRGAIGVAYPLDQQLVTDAAGALYYATTRARGPRQIYRSTNGGASWQPTATGLPAASSGSRMLELASDVSGPPGNVYAAAGKRGVYVTRNAGSTWSRILRALALNIGVGPAGVFVVAVPRSGHGGFYRRGSSGPWTRLSQPPPIDGFVLDPTNSSRLYGWSFDADASTQRYCAKLYGSRDGGVTWTSIGHALPLVREHCGSYY